MIFQRCVNNVEKDNGELGVAVGGVSSGVNMTNNLQPAVEILAVNNININKHLKITNHQSGHQ